jgi:hypothetical protein
MFVFGELANGGRGAVIAGSLLMAAGAGAIAFASAPAREYRRWQEAGARESARYGVDPAYVAARMAGGARPARHTLLDWLLVLAATAVFVGSAMVAVVPALQIGWGWAAALTLAIFGMLVAGGVALWRTTRFG